MDTMTAGWIPPEGSWLTPGTLMVPSVSMTCLFAVVRAKGLPSSTNSLQIFSKISSTCWRFNANNVASTCAPYMEQPDHEKSGRVSGYERDSKVGILNLCERGQLIEAVEALDILVQQASYVDNSLFYSLLKRCMEQKNIVLGSRVHALAVKSGYESNCFLANHIIRMYTSLGRLKEAMETFIKLAAPDRYTWASIILAHTRHGQPRDAIRLYQQMRESPVKPDNHIFVAVLKACTSAAELKSGREVHADILGCADEPNIFVGNCLVDMYAKCGSLEEARRVFDDLPTRDVVTWNTMFAGYAQSGHGQEALALYGSMQQEGISSADSVTYVSLLQACASIQALHQGKQLHAKIRENRYEYDLVVGNCLVNMYAKCGSLEDARKVFDNLAKRDVVTWTALITGYTQNGLGQEALNLYGSMKQEGITSANAVTFVCLLEACASIGSLDQGKQLHLQIRKRGLESDVRVGNCLVNMYAKCGSLEEARRVFDNLPTKDVVTWNAMIRGYVQHGLGQQSLALHARMDLEGMIAGDSVTFVCLLQACASIRSLSQGKRLHAQIMGRGLEADVAIGSSLVDMYAKCGSLEDARMVFETLPTKNVVTWNAMISGYSQSGLGHEALALYASMQLEGISSADQVTYMSLLQACASVGALRLGKHLHTKIQERGLEADVIVGSSLVDMYAKCGSLEDARKVFDRLPSKNVVTWNALLIGYAENTYGQMAMQCFEEMHQQGVEPNETTFICLLVACSHAGLLQEGRWYFQMMVNYGIKPTVKHYNCMVDLLGRSGYLAEAEELLRTIPFQNDFVGWTSLLTACKIHGDVERGRQCYEYLTELEPTNAGPYVLLGSLFANAGMWKEVGEVERQRKAAGAWKKPAKACIEAKNKVHEFTVGEDRSDLSSKLRNMNVRFKDEGAHVPQTELVLKSLCEQDKEDKLCGHAEKLALAYGLLNTPDGSTLLVTKNLRMCNDCHSSTKIMSRLENRNIVVRDAHRVHRFQNGSCSCGDRH